MKIDQRSPFLEVDRELRRISGPAEPKSAALIDLEPPQLPRLEHFPLRLHRILRRRDSLRILEV